MIMPLIRKLVETLRRPGLLGAVGIRREKACTRDVATYFRVLGERLPVEMLAQLSESQHKEAALHSSELTIKTVLRQLQPALISLLSAHILLAFKEGYKHAQVHDDKTLKEAAAKPEAKIKRAPLDMLGPTGQRAADYAATSAAETVAGINATTLDLIQDAISTGIEERLGVGGTGRLIREVVTDMSVKRAATIAATEMNDAISHATLEKLSDLGIEYKKWMAVADPCDICQENEDDGAIPVDDNFSSGDDAPPAHPNCRCAVVGARPPEEDS